jgi:1-acyl-sn-glycerol-3-phosphate acyltransferase
MGFRFKKNERGYSRITFPFMRKTIIPTTKLIFQPRITGREHMPLTGPCFLYGNHSNFFDPFFLNVDLTLEPTAGVMTRDQFHKTIPRIFMDSIGIVPTSKYVPEPGVIRQVIRMIDQKRMIVIFPEGGRRWDGRPKPLIDATLKLFWRMGIPVHPVQLHGSHLAWPRWAKFPRRSSVEVRWLEPLSASDFDDYDTFAEACRQRIDFDEYSPPEGAWPQNGWKTASGLERLLYRCPNSGISGALYTYSGNRVASLASDFDMEVTTFSRLVDREGEEHSLIDIYDQMRGLDMAIDKDGTLLEENGASFFTVDDKYNLVKLGKGYVELTKSAIRFRHGSESGAIPIDKIRVFSVEQAHKGSITYGNKTLQFKMKGSALQWKHYIDRLKNGETPLPGDR